MSWFCSARGGSDSDSRGSPKCHGERLYIEYPPGDRCPQWSELGRNAASKNVKRRSGYERTQRYLSTAMEQGHTAAWDQCWDEAAGFYRQALKNFPSTRKRSPAWVWRCSSSRITKVLCVAISPRSRLLRRPCAVEKISQIYERMGNQERARAASLQAAELQLKNRDISKAIENWTRVTHFQPENLTAHLRLALVYERMGKTDEAVNEYLFLAAIFQRANDLGKAMRAAQHALELKPGTTVPSLP